MVVLAAALLTKNGKGMSLVCAFLVKSEFYLVMGSWDTHSTTRLDSRGRLKAGLGSMSLIH